MTEEPKNLPAPIYAEAPSALSVLLDDRLFRRCEIIADKMANATGVTPAHLIGKAAACFAVVTTAINWRLNPFQVARCTYMTPGGAIGYEGKLCQAIVEASGRLEGPITYEHVGEWSQVQGKFEKKRSDKTGRDYVSPTWTPKDAAGLAVIVRGKMKGEMEPRELYFELAQAFPLNSTLWATDPKTQICYTAMRRFCSLAAPAIFMGLPFDGEASAHGIVIEHDDTPPPPRPKREDFSPAAAGHVDLDERFKEEFHEPSSAWTKEAPPSSPEPGTALPDEPHDKDAAIKRPESPSAAVADGASLSDELSGRVHAKMAKCADVGGLKTFRYTDPDALQLERIDQSLIARMYDEHFKRCKAGR